jgi:hypothetical protein
LITSQQQGTIMATSPGDIVLSDDQRRQLADLANQSGQPWPRVLEAALAAYRPPLAAEPRRAGESLFTAAKRLGLIGCIHGGPEDMSVNPAYLEGLGAEDE